MDKRFILIISVILVGFVVAIGYVSITGNATKQLTNDKVLVDEKTVKEFNIESFYTIENGKSQPQFSIKNITVNKGDFVRIYINTTKGTHDFNIDEFNVYDQTPTGQVTKIEFIADKSGSFTYYCNMPSHRQNGHWGTLTVLE